MNVFFMNEKKPDSMKTGQDYGKDIVSDLQSINTLMYSFVDVLSRTFLLLPLLPPCLLNELVFANSPQIGTDAGSPHELEGALYRYVVEYASSAMQAAFCGMAAAMRVLAWLTSSINLPLS